MLTCGPFRSESTSPALSQDRSTDWRQRVRGLHLNMDRHKLPGLPPSGHDVSLCDLHLHKHYRLFFVSDGRFSWFDSLHSRSNTLFHIGLSNSYSFDLLIPCGNFLKK